MPTNSGNRIEAAMETVVLGGQEQGRAAVAVSVFSRLKVAGLIGPADLTFDTPLADAEADRLSARLHDQGIELAARPKSWGEVLTALVQDRDADGLADLSPEALQAAGLITAEATTEAIDQALMGPVDLDSFEKAAASTALSPQDPAYALAMQTRQQAESVVFRRQDDPALGRIALVDSGNGEVQIHIPFELLQLSAATKKAIGDTAGGELPQSIIVYTPEDFVQAVWASGAGPDLSSPTSDEILTAAMHAFPPGAQLPSSLAGLKVYLDSERAFESGQKPKVEAAAVAWRSANADPTLVGAQARSLESERGAAPLRWFRRLGELRAVPLVDAIQKAALPDAGIDASTLSTIAFGEGLNLWMDGASRTALPMDQEVDGFQYLGTDTIGSRAANLRAKHLLPDDFREGKNYRTQTYTNELGQQVKSAVFLDVASGLKALAALLADERANFLRDCATLKIDRSTVTPEQAWFYTYVYFNAGAGAGRKMLAKNGLKGADRWTQPAPTSNMFARYNSMQRVASWELTERLGIWSGKPQAVSAPKAALLLHNIGVPEDFDNGEAMLATPPPKPQEDAVWKKGHWWVPAPAVTPDP